MIKQKSGLLMIGTVILIVLVAGCLGSNEQNPNVENASVHCSASLVPGQNMTINETQNNATICAKLNRTFTLELSDASLLGDQWIMNASPGLQITDEGMTYYWYYMNGTLLTTSSMPGMNGSMYTGPVMGHCIDRWNVTMTNTGIQTINATLQFYATNEPRNLKTFNWTIVVS
jgi:predicted secreted protein